MTRTTIEFRSNNNQQNVQIIEQILFNYAYQKVGYFNEICYQEAIGGVWQPKFITYFFDGDILIIQAWVTSNQGPGAQVLEYSLYRINDPNFTNSMRQILGLIEANINGVKINEYEGDNQRFQRIINQQQNNNQTQNQQYNQENMNQQQAPNQPQQKDNLTKDAFQVINDIENNQEEKENTEQPSKATTPTNEESIETKKEDVTKEAQTVVLDDNIDLKNSIAIVFNKDELGEDNSQKEAIQICVDNLDLKKAGTFCIFAGDKRDNQQSGYSQEFCVGIKLADTATIKYIRECMAKATDKGLAQINNRFMYEDELDLQNLIYSGYVSNGKLNLKT